MNKMIIFLLMSISYNCLASNETIISREYIVKSNMETTLIVQETWSEYNESMTLFQGRPCSQVSYIPRYGNIVALIDYPSKGLAEGDTFSAKVYRDGSITIKDRTLQKWVSIKDVAEEERKKALEERKIALIQKNKDDLERDNQEQERLEKQEAIEKIKQQAMWVQKEDAYIYSLCLSITNNNIIAKVDGKFLEVEKISFIGKTKNGTRVIKLFHKTGISCIPYTEKLEKTLQKLLNEKSL